MSDPDPAVQQAIARAIHFNRSAKQLEVDIPYLLAAASWEDTEENRDLMTEIVREAASQALPGVRHDASQRARVTKKGIWLRGRRYWAPGCAKLVGATVEIRYADDGEPPKEITVRKAAARFTARPVE
jgi:hypothetical protein